MNATEARLLEMEEEIRELLATYRHTKDVRLLAKANQIRAAYARMDAAYRGQQSG